MIYLKTYEDLIHIGEYVKCINDSEFEYYITNNNLYKVLNTLITIKDHIFLEDNNNVKSWWTVGRFIKATPEEIEEFKIQKDIKKYNL